MVPELKFILKTIKSKPYQGEFLFRNATPNEGALAQPGGTVEHSLKGDNTIDIGVSRHILDADYCRDTRRARFEVVTQPVRCLHITCNWHRVTL